MCPHFTDRTGRNLPTLRVAATGDEHFEVKTNVPTAKISREWAARQLEGILWYPHNLASLLLMYRDRVVVVNVIVCDDIADGDIVGNSAFKMAYDHYADPNCVMRVIALIPHMNSNLPI
jgi:hypothetical protein